MRIVRSRLSGWSWVTRIEIIGDERAPGPLERPLVQDIEGSEAIEVIDSVHAITLVRHVYGAGDLLRRTALDWATP